MYIFAAAERENIAQLPHNDANRYLGWDNFTRPDPQHRSDPERMADLIATTEADGANADSAESDDIDADTKMHLTRAYYDATVAAGRPAAWQAENGPCPDHPTALNWQVGLCMDCGRTRPFTPCVPVPCGSSVLLCTHTRAHVLHLCITAWVVSVWIRIARCSCQGR